MQVKKYIVDSMPEALKKIRKDLGNNAVIIESKKIKVGGIFGFFGKQQIEVIAAVDNTKRETKNEKTVPNKKEEATGMPSLQKDLKSVASTYKPSEPTVQANDVNNESIVSQVREMKDLLTKYILKDGQSSPETNQTIETLRKQGLNEEIVNECLKQLLHERASGESNSGETDKDIVKAALKKTVVPFIGEGISPQTTLAHFIGPTGVGKTTTIAKVAAEQVLKYKRKVGLITSDTYRIAAVDQLRTYANILNVPLEVVYSPKEMQEALNRLSGCDLILMDTAGRNYRNEMYVNELKNLLSKVEHSETYLVLSLASKYEDMVQIIDNFNSVKVDKLIFTKLDETSTYGALFNIINHYRIPLSYMAYGQNVPDDISLAESEKLANSILGERVYGS